MSTAPAVFLEWTLAAAVWLGWTAAAVLQEWPAVVLVMLQPLALQVKAMMAKVAALEVAMEAAHTHTISTSSSSSSSSRPPPPCSLGWQWWLPKPVEPTNNFCNKEGSTDNLCFTFSLSSVSASTVHHCRCFSKSLLAALLALLFSTWALKACICFFTE